MVLVRLGAALSGTAMIALGAAALWWAASVAASLDERGAASATVPARAAPAPIRAAAPLEAVTDHVEAVIAPIAPPADPFAQLARIGLDGEALRERVRRLNAPLGELGRFDLSLIDVGLIDGEARACLAQAIYHEARDQSVAGRLAVADVVMNRVHSRRYPDSVCGVVFQGASRAGGCQFSFACDGALDRPVAGRIERDALAEARTLATVVLGGWHLPLTGGATHYHADYARPYWAALLERTVVVGDHVFYRRPPRLRVAAAD